MPVKQFFFLLFLIINLPGLAQPNVDSLLIAKNNFQAYKVYLSKPDSSIALANYALELAEKEHLNYQLAFSYFVISRANWAKGNYLLSTKYAFRALKIYENSPDNYHRGECLLSIGRTFTDLKNYPLAKTYISKAFDLAVKNKDERLLAEVMREKSFLLLVQKKYDSAMYCTDRGIIIYEKNKDTLNASVLYSRKARIYFELNKFSESQPYITKSLLLDSLVKNRRGLGISYFQAGQVAFHLGQVEKALTLLKKSDHISDELTNLPNKIRVSNLLIEIYKQKKQPDLAIKQMELMNTYKDSLFNLEKSGQIQEIQSIYALEEKDHIITFLENQNLLEKQKARNQQLIIISGGIVAFLLAILSYVLWIKRRLQQNVNKELAIKNQEIELQNEEIQSQTDSLHHINQLKSKILSVISHDLRGPINNLYALLEMVTKKIVTPEEFSELSVKLKSNLNVTQRTLENLLNWSLGQMEGIKTEPVAFNINSVIEDVAHLSEEAATRKQIIFKTDTKAPLFVLADVNQVHLILRNLFNNAIKFSKREGEVLIQFEVKNKFCFVQIQDTGIGMTKSEVEMILNTNEYFTKTGTEQEKGTGLGLLLCKDFIKRNGGEFFIESKFKEGTLITFSLPIA